MSALLELEKIHLQKSSTPSDINEHLPTLAKYASECSSVFETGVCGVVSSYSLLYGLTQSDAQQKYMLMNDIRPCAVEHLVGLAEKLPDVILKTVWKNNLLLDLGEQRFDLTFIDTWHVYAQLKRELAKFAPITNKYIIMHDTTVDGIYGESIRGGFDCPKQAQDSGFPLEEIMRGLWPAVVEFLQTHPEWRLKERLINCNGLTILERVSDTQ
jgi:hypothetical protein